MVGCEGHLEHVGVELRHVGLEPADAGGDGSDGEDGGLSLPYTAALETLEDQRQQQG